MCQWLAQPASRNLSCLLQNRQVFTMSKGNTKAQNMTGTLSTESILITVESNWIQRRLHVKREAAMGMMNFQC